MTKQMAKSTLKVKMNIKSWEAVKMIGPWTYLQVQDVNKTCDLVSQASNLFGFTFHTAFWVDSKVWCHSLSDWDETECHKELRFAKNDSEALQCCHFKSQAEFRPRLH